MNQFNTRFIYLTNLVIFICLFGTTTNAIVSKCNWLETTEGVHNLGLEKIWFTDDLKQAVFLRSGRQEQFSNLNQNIFKSVIQITRNMAHFKDTIYFYNMNEGEIQNWLKNNISVKPSAGWVYLLLPKAHAETSSCFMNSTNSGIDAKGVGFFQKFNSFIKGDFVKKIVGCSTQDPELNEKENQSLSIENFSNMIEKGWEQLKDVVAQLPNITLPEDIKHEIFCSGVSVGIFLAQGAALSATGIGAFAAASRLYAGLNRLLKSVKFLASKVRLAEKNKIQAKIAAISSVSVTQRLENIYNTQKKFIVNMQTAQKQIVDKSGRLANFGKGNSSYDELYDWANAEVNLQKDFIHTLNNLEKAENRSNLTRKISYNTEKNIAEKRIQTLEKSFKL